MDPYLRISIRQYLAAEIHRFWDDQVRNIGSLSYRQERPFHTAISPKAMAAWNVASKHSFYTRSGSWWQRIALLVARHTHGTAYYNYDVMGTLANAAEAHIAQVEEELNQHTRKPNRCQDIEEVLTVQTGQGQNRVEISDLYVKTRSGQELYFEIKTPEPNKAHSAQMKRRILTISALRKGHNARAFGACAYNPSGVGNPYNPSQKYVFQFLEIHKDFLVGREFWEMIAEKDFFDDLLEVWSEVGSISDRRYESLLQKLT